MNFWKKIRFDYRQLHRRCAQSVDSFRHEFPTAVRKPVKASTYKWSGEYIDPVTGKMKTSYKSVEVELDYLYIDNGSNVLAIAHRDTVLESPKFKKTLDGRVICPELDDRLGVYIILDLLPKFGVVCDILLTDGEEIGRSTADSFVPPDGKKYNWMFQFDRHGTGVVMYDYHDDTTEQLMKENNFRVERGSFSDICKLEHLGVKGFNFGTAYYNEHTEKCHCIPSQVMEQVRKFVSFYKKYKDTELIHTPAPRIARSDHWWSSGRMYDDLYGGASYAQGMEGLSCPRCGKVSCDNFGACNTSLTRYHWNRLLANAVCPYCFTKPCACKQVTCPNCGVRVDVSDTEPMSGFCFDCFQASPYSAHAFPVDGAVEIDEQGNRWMWDPDEQEWAELQ